MGGSGRGLCASPVSVCCVCLSHSVCLSVYLSLSPSASCRTTPAVSPAPQGVARVRFPRGACKTFFVSSPSVFACLSVRLSAGKRDANGMRCSQAVTHLSTNRTQRCLTSVCGREPVDPAWYGRWRETEEGSCPLSRRVPGLPPSKLQQSPLV